MPPSQYTISSLPLSGRYLTFAERAAKRPKITKLAQNPALHQYVEDRLWAMSSAPVAMSRQDPMSSGPSVDPCVDNIVVR